MIYMHEQKIQEIRRLAQNVDIRINLFEGYTPKETKTYEGELLFWRQVVNLYGLFADCDRVQIKEKGNLIDLMKRYSLIDKADYDMAMRFWHDISELRKWFCHNNDDSLYYANLRKEKIKNYLNITFACLSDKPEKIEDIQQKDWNILTQDLEKRFETYLGILKKGLSAWKESQYASDIVNEWTSILAKALFSDKELISNVLADIATYERMNQNIRTIPVSALANSYFKKLDGGGFSVKNMENELKRSSAFMRTNRDIVLESIRNSHLL